MLKYQLTEQFVVKEFPHSLNVELADSDLRVQIQNDPRYADFVERAELRDVWRGKIWAAQDPQQRGSKRQKDFADIACSVESYPDLREWVPAKILRQVE